MCVYCGHDIHSINLLLGGALEWSFTLCVCACECGYLVASVCLLPTFLYNPCPVMLYKGQQQLNVLSDEIKTSDTFKLNATKYGLVGNTHTTHASLI